MILVFRVNQTPMSDEAFRRVWLEEGQPGETHTKGIIFSAWEDAIAFARKWAEAYREISVSRPGYLDWSYHPPSVRERHEAKDLGLGPLVERDEMCRFNRFRHFSISWTMTGFIREDDGWNRPWVPYPDYFTSVHVVPFLHWDAAWTYHGTGIT